MIGRGMHPNKLNFFYPLVLLLGIVAIHQHRSARLDQPTVVRWSVIGLLTTPAVVFRNHFSAGAGMIFLLVISGFALFAIAASPVDYDVCPRHIVLLFTAVYTLSIMGSPIHQGSLLGRFSDILLSVVQFKTGTGVGGAGRYSDLTINVLVASTATQTILFTLTALDAIWMFRQREWEYDLVIAWMGFLAVFLVISLTQNSQGTAPQRFYSYVVPFGFNICTGAYLFVLSRSTLPSNWSAPINAGRLLVTALVVALAVTSLVSPVADKATSPVGDEIPHFRQFDTNS